jgi:hypothetical protein
MLAASPNYMRSIYVPLIDEEIPMQQAFLDFHHYACLTYLPLDHPYAPGIDGRSDQFWFQQYGIPASGLFTGAEANKTEELAELFGGTAGIALDPCYHQECDTIDNINKEVLGQMADAAAHVLYTFADTPQLNLTALALEYTGTDRRRGRRLVGQTFEYAYDRVDGKWLR